MNNLRKKEKPSEFLNPEDEAVVIEALNAWDVEEDELTPDDEWLNLLQEKLEERRKSPTNIRFFAGFNSLEWLAIAALIWLCPLIYFASNSYKSGRTDVNYAVNMEVANPLTFNFWSSAENIALEDEPSDFHAEINAWTEVASNLDSVVANKSGNLEDLIAEVKPSEEDAFIKLISLKF